MVVNLSPLRTPIEFLGVEGNMVFIGYALHVTNGIILASANNPGSVGTSVGLNAGHAVSLLGGGTLDQNVRIRIPALSVEFGFAVLGGMYVPQDAQSVEEVYGFYLDQDSRNFSDEGGIAIQVWGVQPRAIWDALHPDEDEGDEDEGDEGGGEEEEEGPRTVTIEIVARGRFVTGGSTNTEVLVRGGEVFYRGHPSKTHYDQVGRINDRTIREYMELLLSDQPTSKRWFTETAFGSYAHYRGEMVPPDWSGDFDLVSQNFPLSPPQSNTPVLVKELTIDIDTLAVT